MSRKFTVIIDRECSDDRWFVWLSEVDDRGESGDEYRTKCCKKKKEAIDRMVGMCRASEVLGAEAVRAVRLEAVRDI